MNSGFVVAMGLGTVFFGLICIILVCKIMSFFVGLTQKPESAANKAVNTNAAAPAANTAPEAIPSRPELAAAIAAAIAEYTGKDISGIRILSIKKL